MPPSPRACGRTLAEVIDTTRIHHLARLIDDRTAFVTTRPFRAPPHTSSDVGLIEGGQVPMPVKVFRVHRDTRLLYERPEFKCSPLDALRKPLRNIALSPDRHLGRPAWRADTAA